MAEKKVKVKLALPTTIAGEPKEKGEIITITETKAKLMRDHGFIVQEKGNVE